LGLVLLLLVAVQQLLCNISTAVRGLLLGRVGLLMAERGGTRGRHHGGLSLSWVYGSVWLIGRLTLLTLLLGVWRLVWSRAGVPGL
jgi:hypothetical protein